MQSLLLISAAIATVLAGANEDNRFGDKATYLANIAPMELSRVKLYRAQNKDVLTTDQNNFLGEVESMVENFDVEKILSVDEDCTAVFTKSECGNLLGGTNAPSDSANRNHSIKRQNRNCECSDESDYCADAHHCLYAIEDKGGGTCYPLTWCGNLQFYVCNGICVRNYPA